MRLNLKDIIHVPGAVRPFSSVTRKASSVCRPPPALCVTATVAPGTGSWAREVYTRVTMVPIEANWHSSFSSLYAPDRKAVPGKRTLTSAPLSSKLNRNLAAERASYVRYRFGTRRRVMEL